MKTINDVNEMIKVMTHYQNGGKVEYENANGDWKTATTPTWDWVDFDYRIKEEKKTVTIEKWLIKLGDAYYIGETSDINALWENDKVKLIETYEVEL